MFSSLSHLITHITRHHRTTDIYRAIVTCSQCPFRREVYSCINTVYHLVSAPLPSEDVAVCHARFVVPLVDFLVGSVHLRLQTLSLCETALCCALFAMSEVDMACLCGRSSGLPPRKESRRRLTEGPKEGAGSRTDVFQRLVWSTREELPDANTILCPGFRSVSLGPEAFTSCLGLMTKADLCAALRAGEWVMFATPGFCIRDRLCSGTVQTSWAIKVFWKILYHM